MGVQSAPEGPAPWRYPLRDHGELWGRPWRVTARDAASLTMEYADPGIGFRFARTLEIAGGTLVSRYVLTSTASGPLPYQWSQHPIFALTPGERLELPGIDRVKATVTAHHALPDGPATVGWPAHDGLPLGTVRPSDGETLVKLYSGLPTGGMVAIRGGPCELTVTTDASFAPYIGIYLNYGGWPPGGPLHHVGIEPTNSPYDDVAAASQAGAAGVLRAGERHRWEARFTLGDACLGPE